jgi:hypothetical protein
MTEPPRIGDLVFVRHDDERAPPELRGMTGTVTALQDGQAQLELQPDNKTRWVDEKLLLSDRRRRRRRADWSPQET